MNKCSILFTILAIFFINSVWGVKKITRFDDCSTINWATWNSFSGLKATGTINNGGDNISVTMTSNFSFSSTPQIYNHIKFNAYPSPIPNTTVPRTTWAAGVGGTTEMCFSKTITNPVLLLASLGASDGTKSKLSFSKPYVVLFDGGNMNFHDSYSLTGVEGFAIIMFPGDFDCVTVNSTTPENYTNITWGLRPPPFPINIAESKGCNEVTLTASGGISYQWNGGLTPNSATNKFTSSGTYIVTVTSASGCKTSVSKQVNFSSNMANVTGSTSGCGIVNLTASGGLIYQWSGGSTPNQASNTFNSSGTYAVSITDANGCVSNLQKTVTITPKVIPTLSIAASISAICEGGTIRFSPTYTNAGTNPTFKWFKNGNQVSTTQIYMANGLKTNDEIYCEITGSDACSGVNISNKIKVDINDLPRVSFQSDIIIEGDGPKGLNPQASASIISYSWFPITGLDNPRIKNPQANPEFTTVYTLTVTDSGGCSAEATIKVTVLKDIFIPNVFSPNGDGKNDQWVIRNISDYIGTKVQIFNRYGQKVFQDDNFIMPWDGILGGKPLPVGNYYYILDLANKSKTRYKGSVTILR